jgi:ribosomal protein L14
MSAATAALKVRRGEVRRGVIVRTRKAVRRPDGRMIRFDDNAVVLINNKREPLGTRIGSLVSADLRMKGWQKIVSMAPKVRQFRLAFSTCFHSAVRSYDHYFTDSVLL